MRSNRRRTQVRKPNTKDFTRTVAVYGSLLSGLHNHRFLSTATPKGKGIVSKANKLTMLNLTGGAYPHVVDDLPKHATDIKVEVYEVDKETADDLDMLEGYPTHYTRKQFPIQLDDGTRTTAWVYIGNDVEGNERDWVADGDWRREVAGA